MKKQLKHLKLFFLSLLIITASSSYAQKQFTHTATKANNSCNYDCTILDMPELNNNPGVIILVTPIVEKGLNLNPNPIGVYYFGKQWRILNLNGKAIPEGAKFNVEYVARPDAAHFQFLITKENLQGDGSSFIDHPTLNNNPNAHFRFFQSWIPEISGGISNRDEISIQFNRESGKWIASNINKKPLFPRVTYNIIVSSEGDAVAGPIKGNPDISINEPQKPVETIPDISKPIEKTGVVKKTIPTSYDFSNVDICVDIINNNSLPPKPPVTLPKALPKISSSGDLIPISAVQQPLAGLTDKMWNPGDVITVGFYTDSATPNVINKVKQYAKVWETYANIKFQFVDDVKQAIIKVGFARNGHWSAIGRDALNYHLGYQTMNFQGFNDATSESNFSRKILHEFGHALGFIHEHQSPAAGISWDKEKVYSFFAEPPDNWSRAAVDQNVFYKYSQTSTNFSAYDNLSIMHYFFPAELTTDGSSFTGNNNLSVIDKQFLKQVYPFPPTPVDATGILRSGDDCDEIVFSVEYNAISNNNEIEFILEPGLDQNNNLITWWKKIGIPLNGGIEAPLELKQDGSSTIQRLPVVMLDGTRGISFAKAKALGVHTSLQYKWNVLRALTGGCRVRFTWRRDKC